MSRGLRVFHQPFEDDEEEKKRELYTRLQKELAKQFNTQNFQPIKQDNLFDDLDTSNMSLRQELEAKFKALNDNQQKDKIENSRSLGNYEI